MSRALTLTLTGIIPIPQLIKLKALITFFGEVNVVLYVHDLLIPLPSIHQNISHMEIRELNKKIHYNEYRYQHEHLEFILNVPDLRLAMFCHYMGHQT
jgi:hypothetical protein